MLTIAFHYQQLRDRFGAALEGFRGTIHMVAQPNVASLSSLIATGSTRQSRSQGFRLAARSEGGSRRAHEASRRPQL